MKKTNTSKKNIMTTKAFKAASKRVMARAWELKKEDSANVWSLCLKMAWAEEKALAATKAVKKAAKANKTSTPKAESNANVDKEIAEVQAIMVGVENGTYHPLTANDALVNFGRKALIQVMKSLHVKGWYRIYDKATMANRILEVAVAA